jgi:hypothetical protein
VEKNEKFTTRNIKITKKDLHGVDREGRCDESQHLFPFRTEQLSPAPVERDPGVVLGSIGDA